MLTAKKNRALTQAEYDLIRWILEHGSADAQEYIVQLDKAEATLWRCECGCASINLEIKGYPLAPPGVHILGDFVFGEYIEMAGVFVFSSDGILSGLEVYGIAGDAPKNLPKQESLRSFQSAVNESSRVHD